jgi:PiT family inorganic phosphate transporter
MMIWILGVTGAVLFVAYANGANDNFKGVATLFGSGTTDYRKALAWATVTTFAGSVTAFFLATSLVKTFTGKGLVPDILIGNPAFLAAVALGAGLTVLLAAHFGIPISTTHGLTGSLVGAGFMAVGMQLGFNTLGKNFFIPLIVSPMLAIIFTAAIYFMMHHFRKVFGITRKSCLCFGEKIIPLAQLGLENGRTLAVSEMKIPEVFVGNEMSCQAKAIEIYDGKFLGVNAQTILDSLHFLSAGAVSFARGLNDTPKIVALLVAAGAIGLRSNMLLVAFVMAIGGILGARKVARTVSTRITSMNHGQGFSANLVTAILVIFASVWGMPVSTTHVSCGALFGIGLVNGKANWKVITSIVGAWLLTLPIAAILSALSFFVLSRLGE